MVKCPPGELYSIQLMKVYDRAHDLEMKYNGLPSQKWNGSSPGSSLLWKTDAAAYVKRIGDMGENLIKIAMEREARGRPGLLVCGLKLKDHLYNKVGGPNVWFTSETNSPGPWM